MKRFAFVLAFLLPLTASAGFDEGVEAYTSGDYQKALSEFKALADQGDAEGQYFVGLFYHNGFGVPRNQAEAAKWFLKAAQQGDPRSQYYVGIMSEKGEGLDKDLIAAYMWLTVSATNPKTPYRDSLYTKEAIQKLEKKMNEEQIAKAKEMAKNWKPAS